VYGAWDEIPNGNDPTQKFKGPLLASEFFLVWPFIVGTVNNMKLKRRERFSTSLKGTPAKVVRDLVRFSTYRGTDTPSILNATKLY